MPIGPDALDYDGLERGEEDIAGEELYEDYDANDGDQVRRNVESAFSYLFVQLHANRKALFLPLQPVRCHHLQALRWAQDQRTFR